MKGAELKKALNADVPQFGMFCSIGSYQVSELLAGAGFDFFLFDVEHTPIHPASLHTQLAMLTGSRTAALVRLANHDPAPIKHYLDLGVDGLMAPNVETAEQARQLAAAVQYPPAGTRGIAGGIRATNYTRDKGYFAAARDRICLAVQIESPRGVENLGDICDVEGVDVVFFGPNDLAAQSGLLGQPTHPDIVAAIRDGTARARGKGKAVGILIGEGDCDAYLEMGARMIAVGSDVGLFVAAADGLAKRLTARRGPNA